MEYLIVDIWVKLASDVVELETASTAFIGYATNPVSGYENLT
jgi:hypothetical protein